MRRTKYFYISLYVYIARTFISSRKCDMSPGFSFQPYRPSSAYSGLLFLSDEISVFIFFFSVKFCFYFIQYFHDIVIVLVLYHPLFLVRWQWSFGKCSSVCSIFFIFSCFQEFLYILSFHQLEYDTCGYNFLCIVLVCRHNDLQQSVSIFLSQNIECFKPDSLSFISSTISNHMHDFWLISQVPEVLYIVLNFFSFLSLISQLTISIEFSSHLLTLFWNV